MQDFIAPIWKKALESAVMSGKAAVIHRKYRKRYRTISMCRSIRQIRRAIVHFALYWNTVNVENKERQECPAPCLEHSFFYPKHLYMKGKYNSLFALDKHLLDEPEQLKRELGIKWNRLVVNLL